MSLHHNPAVEVEALEFTEAQQFWQLLEEADDNQFVS